MGQLAADDAAMFAGAATGYDLDAAELFGMGHEQEAFEGVEGGLGSLAVQVERAGGRQFSGAEAVPGGFVEAGRVLACHQLGWARPGTRGGRCFWLRDKGWFGVFEGGLRQLDFAAGEGGYGAGVVGPLGSVAVGERAARCHTDETNG